MRRHGLLALWRAPVSRRRSIIAQPVKAGGSVAPQTRRASLAAPLPRGRRRNLRSVLACSSPVLSFIAPRVAPTSPEGSARRGEPHPPFPKCSESRFLSGARAAAIGVAPDPPSEPRSRRWGRFRCRSAACPAESFRGTPELRLVGLSTAYPAVLLSPSLINQT